MYKVSSNIMLSPNVYELKIIAPYIVKHARGGQFVIVIAKADGERLPFTICEANPLTNEVTILVQAVGCGTMQLVAISAGEYISDIVGPLGKATDLDKYKNILVVAGGIGVAVVFPQCKQLFDSDVNVTAVMGARNKELLTYTDKLNAVCNKLVITTDDGSEGIKGNVVQATLELINHNAYDVVFAVGPLLMMKAVVDAVRPYSNIDIVVSLNPIMIDGTGMCGCCRVSVDGGTKYACVDGPEFDGRLVDFAELINRNSFYKKIEVEHKCRLTNVGK